MFSTTYAGVIVSLLSTFLPKFGITVGSEELTVTISTIGQIVGSLVAFYGRYKAGGISVLGVKN